MKTLKQLLVVLLVIAGPFLKKVYKLPCKWLLHYLQGKGDDLYVPTEVIMAAKSTFAKVLNYSEEDIIDTPHTVSSSTLYEGKGFYQRPTLFYLVGGFTFSLFEDGHVYGEDVYDWHPTEGGSYYTSPVNCKPLIWLLGLIFGRDLFVTEGWPSNATGISNRLWERMEEAGAKPFRTVISAPVFSLEEMEDFFRGNEYYEEDEDIDEVPFEDFVAISTADGKLTISSL